MSDSPDPDLTLTPEEAKRVHELVLKRYYDFVFRYHLARQLLRRLAVVDGFVRVGGALTAAGAVLAGHVWAAAIADGRSLQFDALDEESPGVLLGSVQAEATAVA